MLKSGVVTCCLGLLVLAVSLEGSTVWIPSQYRVRDLLILIDDSVSISDTEWTAIKIHLVDLVNKVCGAVGPASASTNRLAIATYSSTVHLRFDMTDFSLRSEYINAIRNMRQTKGTYRCLGRALNLATELFTGLPRRLGPREVLILSGSTAVCHGDPVDLITAVRALQEQAFVFGLHLGRLSTESQAQLESLVSKPLQDHIFSLANFIRFDDMVSQVKTYPRLCVPWIIP